MTGPGKLDGSQPAEAAGDLTLLLPARDRLRVGERLPPLLARVLGKGDALEAGKPGREAQLMRAFDVLPRRIPVAPITRQQDAGDGNYGVWLRADPAHVRADMSRARMLACGEFGISSEEAEQFISVLRPLFGDAGFPISAPVPSRWYLMVPAQSQLPTFAAPDDVLGDDLHQHMPEGDLGKRWRHLMNEAQVALHQHPLNQARTAAGKLPVNSLWFWGAGALPDHVRAPGMLMASNDLLCRGLVDLANARCVDVESVEASTAQRPTHVDLLHLRDVAEIESPWLPSAIAQLSGSQHSQLVLDFADGHRVGWRRAHRWRLLRRAARSLT